MSTARPTALIRRAVALPIGLLDRIEASLDARLDAGFTRVDAALDRRISAVTYRTTSLSQGLARSADLFDRALDLRISKLDSSSNKRVAQTMATAHRLGSAAISLETRTDTKLNRGLQAFDRATDASTRAAITTLNASVALTYRADIKITRGFDRVDFHATNAANRAQSRRILSANLAVRATSRIDQRIETDFLRADARVNSGINHTAIAIESAVARVVSATNATDVQIANAVTRFDAHIDRRIEQGVIVTAATINQVNTHALAFERAVDLGISRIDSRIANGKARAVSTSVALTNGVNSADQAITGALARVDSRVEAFNDLSHGQSQGSTNRPTSSLPWAATSLTLVLGTLGAATGASVVNATVTGEIDTTVKIEATAAKDAVSQYLSVRDSFQAAQASRSRTIQTLEQEIAAAQARMTNTSLDGDSIIDVADNYGGVPYVRGGTTPKGFDCSGFTSYVFAQLGVDLPRTSASQAAWADKVSAKDRQVGDLMFWSGRGGVHHVAIYAGDGKMWDSPRPGRQVGKTKIWGNPSYGRVPLEAINASAREVIAEKTAALEKVKAQAPQLEIKIDTQNFSSSSN